MRPMIFSFVELSARFRHLRLLQLLNKCITHGKERERAERCARFARRFCETTLTLRRYSHAVPNIDGRRERLERCCKRNGRHYGFTVSGGSGGALRRKATAVHRRDPFCGQRTHSSKTG